MYKTEKRERERERERERFEIYVCFWYIKKIYTAFLMHRQWRKE